MRALPLRVERVHNYKLWAASASIEIQRAFAQLDGNERGYQMRPRVVGGAASPVSGLPCGRLPPRRNYSEPPRTDRGGSPRLFCGQGCSQVRPGPGPCGGSCSPVTAVPPALARCLPFSSDHARCSDTISVTETMMDRLISCSLSCESTSSSTPNPNWAA